MKTFVGFALVLVLVGCKVNAPYVSDNLQNQTQFHQRIAILPFVVTFNDEYKEGQNRRGRKSASYWQEQERLAGLDLQKELFITLAKRVEKGKLEKVIQDFVSTNKALAEAGIKIQELPTLNRADLCRVLNVDALITGSTQIVVYPFGFGGPGQGGAATQARLFDGGSGELLWSKELSQRPTSGMDTPKRLGTSTVHELAKLLPY